MLLDVPENPPPPMTLAFTPDRPYVPWVPTTLATVQDRLPAILERAEATLQTVTEIVSKVPESLDRSNRFFTNVERIFQESELPALSADSRKFFSTTSGQIDKIATDLERVIGTDGTLVTFVENANAAIKAADLPTTNQSARAAADQTTLAADDLRRALPAIRDSLDQLRDLARQLAGAAGVGRLWPTTSGSETMTRVIRAQDRAPRRARLPGGNRLPAETARDDTGPHDRAATARAAGTGARRARARAERPRPLSGCSIRKRVDTLAAGCFTNNLMASS